MGIPDGMVTWERAQQKRRREGAAAAVGPDAMGKGSGLGVLEVGLAELAATSV